MKVISTSERVKQTLADSLATYEETRDSAERLAQLNELALRSSVLVDFIYLYTFIEDPLINSDDEIINWTVPDIAEDYSNAIWNLACGYYKGAASALRNAYEMTAVSLSFQIEENVNPRPGQYCSELFATWDRGDADTPKWSVIKARFRKRPSVASFDQRFNSDIVAEFHAHYHELCAFTHGRPFSKTTRLPTNATNISSQGFDQACFSRLAQLVEETLSLGAAMWLLAYPEMISKPGPYSPNVDYRRILTSPRAVEVLNFASAP